MKTAIIIQAHKNPRQVARLCGALRHPDFDLFLNLDAKSDLETFRREIQDVTWIEKRIPIYWGGFSQVRATLNALEQVLDAPQKYDFVMLASGQDYPIVLMSEIARQLNQNPGRQFMNYRKIEDDNPVRKWFQRHHVELRSTQRSNRINHLIRKCLPPLRNLPFAAVYKGSQWWTLSVECARYVVERARNDQRIMRIFNRTHCSDESFFHTLIFDSEFAQTVVPSNRRYIKWVDRRPHPEILTVDDYDSIVATDNWIARKFDMNVDARILDLLDRCV